MSNYFFKENRRTGRDNIVMEDVRIIWRNFSGEERRHNGQIINKEGNRNFTVIIDDPEFANECKRLGWNVKEKQGRDEDDDPYFILTCAVSYTIRPPKIVMYAGKSKTNLGKETVSSLDFAEIVTADLILNGSPWEASFGSGIKAYVDELHVVIEESAFSDKYADYE